MAARRLIAALVLSGVLGACADATGPRADSSVTVQLSVDGPQLVSEAETTALGEAFDRVDRYQYTVVDSVTREEVSGGSIDVTPGAAAHTLDIEVPEGAIGRTVEISLVAYDGETELYRSTVFTRLSEDVGTIRVAAEIRYSGPGIRGAVREANGDPVGGLSIALLAEGSTVGTVVTEEDGTYLFVDLAVGSYSVQPAAPVGVEICPVVREVVLGSTDDAVITDFRAQNSPCGTRALVLSGGDFDETQAVAELLSQGPDLTADTTFFYLNQLPSLDFLSDFDVVLLFANGLFDESTSLGGRLAEYVGAGGNLVVASFYFQNRGDSGLGSVGWGALEGLDPFTAVGGGATYQAVSLDPASVVAHPITAGVTALTSNSYSSGVEARAGTTVLASWSPDGAPLVGYRLGPAGQRIVAVSLYPAATASVTGDAQTLWINAVSWAGEVGGPG